MSRKLLFFLSIILLSITNNCQAAFPIAEAKKQNHIITTKQPNKYYNTHSEDMGVFGILAAIFAVTGLFPLAIASGIIGTQNGRKFKGLARAGLVLGILVGMAFAAYLMYLFILG
jgi:uncharacterized membrane protein